MRLSLNASAAAALLAVGLAQAAEPPEVTLSTAQRTALGITVYNDGQALVRDTRKATLARGVQRVAFRDVAATIVPETAALQALGGTGFALLEQNFDFDLLSPESLLQKYVGRRVTVTRTNPATGAETSEQATVLATNSGVVLRYADRIETSAAGRLSFADVPANLRDRPTLSMLVDAPKGGEQPLELMYLANSIAWKADYVANLDAGASHMTLAGWVTLTNQSGTAYEDARLQLVAGTLNRVRAQRRALPLAGAVEMQAKAAAMSEEGLADYHLYTLARPTTIAQNQTKQVALLSAANVPVRREYELLPGAFEYWYLNRQPGVQKGLKPGVYLKFENRGGDLGIPLPAGTVRVYQPDRGGAAQFVGEDALAHTAKGEEVTLRLGEAFDITADRVQTGYRALGERARENSYRIEIRNARAQPVTVTVRESLRGEWSISSESHPHVKESASSVYWLVDVPAEGRSTLEYTAIVSW
jgi:hypothetical protein